MAGKVKTKQNLGVFTCVSGSFGGRSHTALILISGLILISM